MPLLIANPTDDRIRAKRFRFDKPSGTFREGKPVERFIAGPLPLWWVTASNALPGKAGAVGLHGEVAKASGVGGLRDMQRPAEHSPQFAP